MIPSLRMILNADQHLVVPASPYACDPSRRSPRLATKRPICPVHLWISLRHPFLLLLASSSSLWFFHSPCIQWSHSIAGIRRNVRQDSIICLNQTAEFRPQRRGFRRNTALESLHSEHKTKGSGGPRRELSQPGRQPAHQRSGTRPRII